MVEPTALRTMEDVRITDVYYFEDLANYIDKILFTFKNTPAEVANLKPFVPKPKGTEIHNPLPLSYFLPFSCYHVPLHDNVML